MGSRAHISLVLGGAIVVLTATSAPALGYPQWQFSSGAARCNQCHYSPAGGGLITSYGRDADGDELSTFRGNGALLHGVAVPPPWLALGGDFRGATVASAVQDPAGPTYAVFPMQADLEARIGSFWGVSFYATGGFRGQVRTPDNPVPLQNYQPIDSSRLISREHYIMWQPEVLGPYVRAGRFFAPFGLRFAEHVTYVRRDLGFNLLQESYNLSAGFVVADSELHVTAFAPDFVRHIGSDEKGVLAYYEHRMLNDTGALAVQSKLAFDPGITRLIFGGVGKLFVERANVLFLGEVDAVRLMFDAGPLGSRTQVVAAAGLAVLPVRGIVLTLLGERNQTDLEVRDSALTAGTLLLNWFPYAHTEVEVMGRLQSPSGGDMSKTLLAQLHYFL
jgi:hypothetical protein